MLFRSVNLLHELNTEPKFEKDSLSQWNNRRLTLPADKVIADPFRTFIMTGFSNDFSYFPSFALIDTFNHSILKKKN